MGKITGGPFGVIRGKTSGLNFKYSGGKNIVSKYVPNPRNPKSNAQLNTRSIFKSITKGFQKLDKTFVSIAFNSTAIYKSSLPRVIQQFYNNNEGIQFETVPAGSWLRHWWRIIADTIQGHQEGVIIQPPAIYKQSLLTDCVAYNSMSLNEFPVISAQVFLNDDQVLCECPESINVVMLKPSVLSLMPFGFSLCFDTGTPWDTTSDQYVDSSECYVNLGMFYGNLMFAVPPINNNSNIVNEISKHFISERAPVNFVPPIETFTFLGSQIYKDLPLSNIKNHSGLNLFESEFEDGHTSLKIDWLYKLKSTDFIISYLWNGKAFTYSFNYNVNLPTEFLSNDWHLELQYFNYNKGNNPTKNTVVGAKNTALLTNTITFVQDNPLFAALLYVVIDGVCVSTPLRIFVKDNNNTDWSKVLFQNIYELPYRIKNFQKTYNIIGKVCEDDTEYNLPLEGCSVTLFSSTTEQTYITTSDEFGFWGLKLPNNIMIDYIIYTCNGNVVQKTINKLIYSDSAFVAEKIDISNMAGL